MPRPQPPKHAVAQVDDPQLVQMNAHRGDQEAAAEAQRGGEHRLARPDAFHPAAEYGSGGAQKDDGNGKDPAHLLQIPVTGRRLSESDELGERQVEGGEGVGLADG